MYYPSLFAGVRPFEGLRDRVDNPLDLSVKQTVRPDAPEHQNLQLMIERKLGIGSLPSRQMPQQMPLLDTMYAYKPFMSDPPACALGGAALMSPSLASPYCTSAPSASGISHLGLIPDLMHQNRETLALEASSMTPFPLDVSALPYHMRIGSATAAAIAINSANQRAYFGHNSMGPVLPPHMGASFGPSISHYSLYSDLLNDMNRRPIEPEKSVFSPLASMRAPAEPTTRFSEHLQRLRDHNLHHSKCSAPCCQPASAHPTNGCNCCNIGLSINNNMTSMVVSQISPLSVPSKEVFTHSANSESSCGQSVNIFDSKPDKTSEVKCVSRVEPNTNIWEPSVVVVQQTAYHKENKEHASEEIHKTCHKYKPPPMISHDVITIDEDCNDIEITDVKLKSNKSQNSIESIGCEEQNRDSLSAETSCGQKEITPRVESSVHRIDNSVKCNESERSVGTVCQLKSMSAQVRSDSTQETAHHKQSHNHMNRETQKSNEDIGVKSNAIKQLKDYKYVNKNQNITAIDKRHPKETKTVEVQCNGPDWTPIVLPIQLKTKLQKTVRLSLSDSKSTTKRSITHKKETKKSKKSKQKHIHIDHIHSNHRNHNRSRSSSSSTASSRRSSPENSQHFDDNSCKSKKKSMLQCLVNSDGYVGDKIKANAPQHNLIVSDPSQLGREERALQRAIKHFEELHKPEKSSIESSQISSQDNGSNNSETNSEFENDIKKYQKIIESVVNESRLKVQSSDSPKKCSKERPENEDSDESMDSLSKAKNKVKSNSKKRLIESFETKGGMTVKFSEKKVKPNDEKSDEKKMTEHSIECKQKKAITSVRRRRFRSGLDMIRHPNRRKKTHPSAIRGGKGSHFGDHVHHKSNSESAANGSSEGKRLMVNKALGETLLHRAARSNRIDVVNCCLQSNTCDVNAKDNANYTPLHECSTRGNLEIAALLLQSGAHVDSSATGGIRPLHDAIENNHIEVVRLLLSYGADPYISTYSGATPLQLARSKHMTAFLTGFLGDISGDKQKSSQPLLWKFSESAHISDPKQIGFNVFDGLPSDEEESHDFVFEESDSPLDPSYRLRNSKESNHFMRLSGVLKRTGITRDEWLKRHPNIEIVSIGRHELQRSTIGQSVCDWEADDSSAEEMLVLDDSVRSILGIESLRLC